MTTSDPETTTLQAAPADTAAEPKATAKAQAPAKGRGHGKARREKAGGAAHGRPKDRTPRSAHKSARARRGKE